MKGSCSTVWVVGVWRVELRAKEWIWVGWIGEEVWGDWVELSPRRDTKYGSAPPLPPLEATTQVATVRNVWFY